MSNKEEKIINRTTFLTKMLKLRKARLNDAKFVLSLRNEKITRKSSIINQNIISLENHLKWFSNHSKEYQIIIHNNKDIGYLRFKPDDNGNEVGICLLPEYRNKKIGSKILKKTKGNALIRIENKQSFYAFTNAGYKLVGFYLKK